MRRKEIEELLSIYSESKIGEGVETEIKFIIAGIVILLRAELARINASVRAI